MNGYVPASGDGSNGVLIIAEAAGEHEVIEAMPLIGKAGYFLFQNLNRVGIEREGFRVHNVLSCRPPNNKLAGEEYADKVIAYCAPLLDNTIFEHVKAAQARGQSPVIVTLGKIAFKRVIGINDKSPIFKQDYYAYPFWSDQYQCWVMAAPHPSYLMRGNNHELPVLRFVFKRALEIAQDGLKFDENDYLLDPSPATFQQWVTDFEKHLNDNPETILSYDIETPYKQGKSEQELAKEDEDDYIILRCSFSYKPNQSVSVLWDAHHRPMIEQLFASRAKKLGWNSEAYDFPRISVQMPVEGDRTDGMLAWHVLNSALDKGLGFVTPFYVPTTGLWKHLADDKPAFYNAKDADMALRCYLGIQKDLIANDLWRVFDRHIIQLNRALSYMSGKGVQRDEVMRAESEKKLQDMLDAVEIVMEASVPQEARRLHPKNGYKKEPKDVTGLVKGRFQVELLRCLRCNMQGVSKNHVAPKKKGNTCEGAEIVKEKATVERWAKPLEFKVSKVGLTKYQKVLQHQAIVDRKKQKVSFDESALMKLMKQYPSDPLYPRILEHRELQKLLGTYIGVTEDGIIRGGMPVGRDGRIHTLYNHNPQTLRLASQDPNLQNLPRPKGTDDLATIIRNLIVAGPGNIFTATDYSGIEAVLVGYFACAPAYIRLAKLDVHSFYTAYALHELDGRMATADLPDASWPDDRLIPALKEIKNRFKGDRNELYKHLVHGANFFQGPFGAKEKIFKETGKDYPVNLIKKVMDIYFALFPDIRKWHNLLWRQTEDDGFIRNPFGYVLRLNKVYDYEKIGGKWQKKPGPDANKAVAFLPQSTAAGIIKEALMRLFFNRFEEAGQFLRLQVHDELLAECPLNYVEQLEAIMKDEMEKPVPELRLPVSYGMGSALNILTENKRGGRWGQMH